MENIMIALSSLTLYTILPVVILVAVGLLVNKTLMKLVDRSLAKSRLEKAAKSLIRSLTRVVLYVVLGMMVAEKLGIDVSGVLALSTVATLAVSLSMQEMLTNIVGGFTVLSNHPFKAGDYVEVAGQAGTVESIDIAYTKLITPDNKVISIPNSAVVASQIVNYSTSATRRIDFNVTASYDSDMETVKAALLEAAQVDGVLADPAPFAAVTKYGESSIEYVLRVWSPNEKYWDVTFAINHRIKATFDEHGVSMTYPHLNVHLDK